MKKTTKKERPPQDTASLRPVAAFSAKELSAAAFNARTGESLQFTSTRTTGYGIRGYKVDYETDSCYCKIVESTSNPDDNRYYIGVNQYGVVVDPITGGGSGETKRVGWISVPKSDFDLYYQDIKNTITAINIATIRAKYAPSTLTH